MKITQKKIKRFAAEGLIGAVAWTVLLTPYMVLITKMTVAQYISWLIMEFVLIPPLAPIVFRLTGRVLRRLKFEN